MSGRIVTLLMLFIVCRTDAFDPLDPRGNVTINWNIIKWGDGGDRYDALVSILNYQLFRHVEKPGWKLQWDWAGDEVIWNMLGAEAVQQGNCHRIKSDVPPHCCKKTPQIIDLLPGAPYNMQTANCCKGGVLSSMNQDPSKFGSTFQMAVGNAIYVNTTTLHDNTTALGQVIPQNFSLGLPGYTCNVPKMVEPTKFLEDGGRRTTEAFLTWNITCTYSQIMASPSPTCCVSLSAFYNESITYCPKCSCACRGEDGVHCTKPGEQQMLQMPHSEYDVVPPDLMCTRHMCPIHVHWHVKTSYTKYWRVKITIHNLNYAKNYTGWTLVVQHPNLRSLVQIFSFNYKPLNQYGTVNDTGMFHGIRSYNDVLLHAGDTGNVQSEILLHKDDDFTFGEGWGFPRKISFNGEECVVPPPDEYPMLPNSSASLAITTSYCCSILFLSILIIFLL